MAIDLNQENTHCGDSGSRPISNKGKLDGMIALITWGNFRHRRRDRKMLLGCGSTSYVTGTNPATLQAAREDLLGVEVIASDASELAATRTLIDKIKSSSRSY